MASYVSDSAFPGSPRASCEETSLRISSCSKTSATCSGHGLASYGD